MIANGVRPTPQAYPDTGSHIWTGLDLLHPHGISFTNGACGTVRMIPILLSRLVLIILLDVSSSIVRVGFGRGTR